MVSNPVLVASCLVYLSNVFTCWMMGEITYAKWFGALVATSLVYHTNTNIYANIIDKISIAAWLVMVGILIYSTCGEKTKIR